MKFYKGIISAWRKVTHSQFLHQCIVGKETSLPMQKQNQLTVKHTLMDKLAHGLLRGIRILKCPTCTVETYLWTDFFFFSHEHLWDVKNRPLAKNGKVVIFYQKSVLNLKNEASANFIGVHILLYIQNKNCDSFFNITYTIRNQ